MAGTSLTSALCGRSAMITAVQAAADCGLDPTLTDDRMLRGRSDTDCDRSGSDPFPDQRPLSVKTFVVIIFDDLSVS